MTPGRVYYITYLDPTSGFLKRYEATSHKDRDAMVETLRDKGVVHYSTGSYVET